MGGKTELVPDVVVKLMLETDWIGFPMIPAPLGDLRAGASIAPEEIPHDRKILRQDGQFAADRTRDSHDLEEHTRVSCRNTS
jgi:hypothetical protein